MKKTNVAQWIIDARLVGACIHACHYGGHLSKLVEQCAVLKSPSSYAHVYQFDAQMSMVTLENISEHDICLVDIVNSDNTVRVLISAFKNTVSFFIGDAVAGQNMNELFLYACRLLRWRVHAAEILMTASSMLLQFASISANTPGDYRRKILIKADVDWQWLQCLLCADLMHWQASFCSGCASHMLIGCK